MNGNAASTEPAGGGRTTWLVGAIVAIVLVVVAAAAILIVDERGDAGYPPDSPEAAFQAYAHAWDEGDTESAWDMFTPAAQGRVSHFEFRDANRWREDEVQRIWIDDRSGTDERVTLRLTVETVYRGGLFGSDRWQDTSVVTLVDTDDGWKIDTPLVGYQRW
jgi:hypothetical protein